MESTIAEFSLAYKKIIRLFYLILYLMFIFIAFIEQLPCISWKCRTRTIEEIKPESGDFNAKKEFEYSLCALRSI